MEMVCVLFSTKTIISGGNTHISKDAACQRGKAVKAKTQKFNNCNSSFSSAEKF
jgi:hypothetical protein